MRVGVWYSLLDHTPLLPNIQSCIQWNLFVKDTLNKGCLSNEDTVCSPNHIELCTNLFTSELGTPLYTRQPAIERFHCLHRMVCSEGFIVHCMALMELR